MHPQSRWLTIVVVFSLGTGAACGATEASKSKQTMVLTEQSAGAIAHASVGEAIEIRLPAQPGTGFSWVPKGPAGMVSAQGPVLENPLPGGQQTQRFIFSAQRAGTYRVNFSYDQPWAGGIKGAKTQSFTVVVR